MSDRGNRFYSDRLAVRNGNLRHFSDDFHDDQLHYLLGHLPNDPRIAEAVKVDLRAAAFVDLRVHRLLTILTHQDDFLALLEEYLALPTAKKNEFLDHVNAPIAPTGLSPRLAEIGRQFSSLYAQVSILSPKGSQDQIEGPRMHWTFSKRQSDSNIFLNQIYTESTLRYRNRTALFIGGSLGITAIEFLKSLDDSVREHWEVLSSDLFPPQEIFQRLKDTGDEGFPYRHLDRFPTLSSISYLCADMQRLPFAHGSIDLIDACNVLGYVTNLNGRLRIMENLWDILKVDGYMRLVTPSYENLFEQIVVRKTDAHGGWELAYASLTGKSLPPNPVPERLFEDGTRVCAMAKKLRGKTKVAADAADLTPVERAILSDLCCLSPIRFGGGIFDDYRLLPGRMFQRHGAYVAEVTQALESLLAKLA